MSAPNNVFLPFQWVFRIFIYQLDNESRTGHHGPWNYLKHLNEPCQNNAENKGSCARLVCDDHPCRLIVMVIIIKQSGIESNTESLLIRNNNISSSSESQ